MRSKLLIGAGLALPLIACDRAYDGPEPFDPLPADSRLGEAALSSFAGRGARFLVGAGLGGQGLADLRPAGFEIEEDGDMVWRPAESALYWFAEGAAAPEPLEGALPQSAGRLGISLLPRAVVAAPVEAGSREFYVVRDGASHTYTANEGLDGPFLVLGPRGEALVGGPDAPWLCGESGCRPAWSGAGRAPVAWTELGFLLAWIDGEEVCAGWAPEGGAPEDPVCAAVPTLAPASVPVFAGWQGEAAPQIFVSVSAYPMQGVKAYTFTGDALEPGEVLASCGGSASFGEVSFDRASVAPGGTTVFLHETPLLFDCPRSPAWSDFPRLNRVEGGAYQAMAWPFSYARLTCECDRRRDPGCGCWSRAVPPQVFPSRDGSRLRVFSFEAGIDGFTRLWAVDHPLPTARAVYYDDTCARSCGDYYGRCFLNYDLSETCAVWDRFFNAETGVPVAGLFFDVRCEGSAACFDVEVEATPVAPADAFFFDPVLYPLDFSGELTPYEVFVEADTVWDITARKAGYQPVTQSNVRAGGPAESVVLPDFVLRR